MAKDKKKRKVAAPPGLSDEQRVVAANMVDGTVVIGYLLGLTDGMLLMDPIDLVRNDTGDYSFKRHCVLNTGMGVEVAFNPEHVTSLYSVEDTIRELYESINLEFFESSPEINIGKVDRTTTGPPDRRKPIDFKALRKETVRLRPEDLPEPPDPDDGEAPGRG